MTDMTIRDAEIRGVIDFTRQRDWFDPAESDARVTLYGAGGIGSPTALALAKLGIPNLTLIDPDVVDVHNLPNQMFPLDVPRSRQRLDDRENGSATIGLPKVEVLEETLGMFGVSNVETHQAKGEDVAKPRGIVVSGLDSMAAREAIWNQVKYNIHVPFYVDARIGGESIVLYTLDPRKPAQCEYYETTLHSDDEAQPAPCTRRSVIDVGFVTASLITRAVRRHLADETPEHTLFWNHADLRCSAALQED